jgi:aspartyl/asparaginyl beta-hydroxylase (cupin superfamily)
VLPNSQVQSREDIFPHLPIPSTSFSDISPCVYYYFYVLTQVLLMVFSAYNLNPDQFEFLPPFQAAWQDIRDEFIRFCDAPDDVLQFAYNTMGPKSRMIKTADSGHPSKYSAFGLWYQGQFTYEFLRAYGIRAEGLSLEETMTKSLLVQRDYFPKLTKLLMDVYRAYPGRIRTAYFGTFHPGMKIKLHVNDNRLFYRGYLGLLVPQGDVAMRICSDTLYWKEGEFMVLDHTYPHCPHNNTNEKRTVLVVDFIKPELHLDEALRNESIEIAARMNADPKSLGVFGGNDYVSEAVIRKYGLDEQLSWGKDLSSH